MNSDLSHQEVETLSLSAKPIVDGLSLNRKAFLLGGILAGFVLFFILTQAFSTRARNAGPQTELKGALMPNEAVLALPETYRMEAKRREIAAPPPDSSLTELDRMAAERLKRQNEARASAIAFKSNPPTLAPISKKASESETEQSGAKNSRYLNSRVSRAASPYMLQAGTVIPCLFLSAINSDLPGVISGQVSEDVFDSVTGQHLLVPMGARVIGRYDNQIIYGQERVLIIWDRLLFPNGSALNLQAMPGVSAAGESGIKDRVNNHYGKLLGGVLISSLLGAGAQVVAGPQSPYQQSYPELAAQGAAREINRVGQDLTRRAMDIKPTIEIRPGLGFAVFVTKDILLKPYADYGS